MNSAKALNWVGVLSAENEIYRHIDFGGGYQCDDRQGEVILGSLLRSHGGGL